MSDHHLKDDNLSDEELVRRTLSDRDQFLYLVERYKGRLLSYIRRLTSASQEDAEDILQEVFIKAYLNLNGFKPDLKFSSWIYRITHNQVISQHRRLKARPEGYLTTLEDGAVQTLVAETDIISELDIQMTKEKIASALVHLPEKYREIIILRFFEERDYQEISDIIKKPLGTVASLLSKAKIALKKQLALVS